MKIAFFVSAFPVRSETFILQQIAGLLERGHEVDVYTGEVRDAAHLHSDFQKYKLFERTRPYRSTAAPSLSRRLRQRARLLLANALRHPGVVFRSLNVFRYGRPALSLDLLDMALCLIDRPAYDIVHCHFGPNGNNAAMLIDLGVLHGKLVVTFHSYDVLRGIETNGRVYRRLLRHADAVHSISEYNRKWLESFGFLADRIYRQPMGIDVVRFGAPAGERGRDRAVQILTVARLAPEKGLTNALAALAVVRRKRPDLAMRYRVIGDGPLRGTLQAQARQLGLNGVVEFLGSQDQEVVRRALREADVLLLPSLAEALPIAIMEAMASGLPVIATDVGGVAELVRDGQTGRLVPPGDPARLEAALLDLLTCPHEERQRLGRAGRALVSRRHDTRTLADRLVEHYHALVRANDRQSNESKVDRLRSGGRGRTIAWVLVGTLAVVLND